MIVIASVKNPNAGLEKFLSTHFIKKEKIYFATIPKNITDELLKLLKFSTKSEFTVWMPDKNGVAGFKVIITNQPTIEDIIIF